MLGRGRGRRDVNPRDDEGPSPGGQHLTQLTAHSHNETMNGSVPARHISDGAAPCPYWLAPCPIYKRPARIRKKKKKNTFFILFFFHLQNFIAVVFSDSRCRNACACRFVLMFSSIAYKIVPKPRFVRVLDCDRIFIVHA